MMPEASDVYRNVMNNRITRRQRRRMFIERRWLKDTFDPNGVARSLDHGRFYTHANPPGLGKKNIKWNDAGGITCL